MPTTGFIRGNTNNAIGSFARVLIANYSYPPPRKISPDIIDLSGGAAATYNVSSTYGFRDIGITGAPFQMSMQADVQNWDSQQVVRFKTVPTNYFGTVSTTALELTQQNKVNLMNASAAADVSASEHQTNYAARTNFPIYRIAVVWQDEYNLFHASLFPRCQWDGSAIQQTLERGQPHSIPFSFMIYPDEGFIDSVTGQPCYRVDFDQF